MNRTTFPIAVGCLLIGIFTVHAADAPQFERDIAPLLKRHCVKCHGPVKQERKLNVSSVSGLIRGGESGAALVPHDVEASLLWKRVSSDEMPPDAPLSADEKSLLKRWIIAGTPGLARDAQRTDAAEHWAFRSLGEGTRGTLDSFLLTDLAPDGLTFSPVADRATQIRRVSFDLTGLPPTPEAMEEFIADQRPDAYERMVDRYLASPHYGERLGKLWLDAAGYADSNGYFSADTDRPLAYRYRDYVVRAINSNKPFDQFVREQLAGDELANITARNGQTIVVETPASHSTIAPQPSTLIELLEATHYLRNGQDGSGESDGNPDEVQVDRYTVIETAMQNVSTGLLGLTIQCAKCHDHKFEPLTQRDYYSLQAVLIPAFPPEQWVKPNDRFIYASLPGEVESWQEQVTQAEATVARLQSEITEWVKQHRPRGTVLFADGFDAPPESLSERWSHTAPGDDAPGGTAVVNVNSREAPGAIIVDGKLQLIEGGPGGDKWLSTKMPFDWTPDAIGAAIQVTFDLIDNRVEGTNAADRIGYFIALHDFNDNSLTPGGNILIDGHPTTSTAVHPDYPGNDSTQAGVIGTTGYQPGRNYGVRITNKGDGKFVMEHLIDGQTEEKSITFAETDLPAGGFGFEFCCGRSFIIDNVSVESFAPTDGKHPLTEFLAELKSKRGPLDEAMKTKTALAAARPGKIAWTTDLVDEPPQTHVFIRGNYNTPGEPVEPAGFAILSPSPRRGGPGRGADEPSTRNSPTSPLPNPPGRGEGTKPKAAAEEPLTLALSPQSRGEGTKPKLEGAEAIGRRLAFANGITQPGTPASSLLARVHVNRLWQHHFGTGIVSTPDNFGVSGSPPSHPELLDWLASEFIRSGWSPKHVTRLIVNSAAYRQSSLLAPSPPSGTAAWVSREKATVRGPSSENDPPNTSDSTLPPSPRRGGPGRGADEPSTRNSPASPLPNPLRQGEGTKPKATAEEPLTLALSPQSRGEGTRAADRLQHDSDARRLSRFPVRRLDAEAIRDAMLFASGDLDDRLFGPYIATTRTGNGEIVVAEDKSGSHRRSIYLQQKRTQIHSLLQVFDAPSIVFNSTRRPRSTMPLQSLSLLNSEFAVARARSLASRLEQEATDESERLTRAFVLTQGHPPTNEHVAAAMLFLAEQAAEYARPEGGDIAGRSPLDARQRAWHDLSQMLLIGNAALYLE